MSNHGGDYPGAEWETTEKWIFNFFFLQKDVEHLILAWVWRCGTSIKSAYKSHCARCTWLSHLQRRLASVDVVRWLVESLQFALRDMTETKVSNLHLSTLNQNDRVPLLYSFPVRHIFILLFAGEWIHLFLLQEAWSGFRAASHIKVRYTVKGFCISCLSVADDKAWNVKRAEREMRNQQVC